ALLSFEPFLKGENKKRDNIICMVIGAAFFFGGHIAYTIAFIRELKVKDAFNPIVFIIAWVGFITAGIIVKIALKVSLGNLTIPILIYTICLTAMGAMSLSLAIYGLDSAYQKAIMLIAPIFFIISDATLGLKFGDTVRFGKKKIKYLTLITYYTAQMLFGYSITFLG
ncbi:MAG: lysoplasmalogenase, partial [Eubacterium sp.]|nr:lysoplasmalogenase [Eubacterium sp.]